MLHLLRPLAPSGLCSRLGHHLYYSLAFMANKPINIQCIHCCNYQKKGNIFVHFVRLLWLGGPLSTSHRPERKRAKRTLYGNGNRPLFVITWHQVNYPMCLMLCVCACILFTLSRRSLPFACLVWPFLVAQTIPLTIVWPIPKLNALFFHPKILFISIPNIFTFTHFMCCICMHSIKRVRHVACPEMMHAQCPFVFTHAATRRARSHTMNAVGRYFVCCRTNEIG